MTGDARVRGRARGLVGIVALVAAVVAGCSGDSSDGGAESVAPESASPRDGTAEQGAGALRAAAWQGARYTVGVGVAEGVAIAVKTSGGDDVLTGIDEESGEVLWERPTSPGQSHPDSTTFALMFTTAEDRPMLVNVSPPMEFHGGYRHALELVDPATGRLVGQLGRYWIGARWWCGNADAVCVNVWDSHTAEDNRWSRMRINPDTLTLESWDEEGPIESAAGWRGFGDGVYGIETESGQQFLMRRETDGSELWRVPADEAIFKGARAAGNFLAGSRHVGDDYSVLHGTFTSADDEFSHAEIDQNYHVVVLNKQTGQRLWGAIESYPCGGSDAVLVLCSGDLTLTRDEGLSDFNMSSGSVALTGYAVATGEVLWTLPAAEVEGLRNSTTRAGFIDPDNQITLSRDGVIQTIDISSGDATDLGESTGMCWKPEWEPRHQWSNPDKDMVDHALGGVVSACNDSGDLGSDARFSQAQILGAELDVWQADSELTNDDLPGPRWHVILTDAGIRGYEF